VEHASYVIHASRMWQVVKHVNCAMFVRFVTLPRVAAIIVMFVKFVFHAKYVIQTKEAAKHVM